MLKKGSVLRLEISGKAKPSKPSKGSENPDDEWVTAENVWSVTSISATVTVSLKIGPETVESSPYSIEKVPGSLVEVEDKDALYVFLSEQPELAQDDDGTQRSEDPAEEYLSQMFVRAEKTYCQSQ